VARIAFCAVAALSISSVMLASASTLATPWGTIGGIAVGTPQTTVVEQRGPGVHYNAPCPICVDLRYYGRVLVEFQHQRVLHVGCAAPGPMAGRGCPRGFALPDGVALGTSVEPRSPWRGYARYIPSIGGEYDFVYGKKSVRVAGRTVWVYLVVEKGRVIGVTESAGT